MDLNALTDPREGPSVSTGGLYMIGTENGEAYCQLTGKLCLDVDEDFSHHDCRSCTVPIVAAICRLSRTIGSQGRD